MRKIYAALLSFSLFFALSSRLNAQAVGTYGFLPSSGTYTPLAGATTSTAAGDDGTQNIPIGFSFVFGGVSYSNAVISTNGAVKLAADGTTTFPTSWVNTLSNTYNAAIVAPLWDDNNATGGSVVYLTTGSAPNRTFSVEWINIHLGGGGSTTTPTGTFQLTLTESSNSVQFVYGTINTLTGSSISIGLNDLVSFLSVTPGAPATASSTTANNNITSEANLTSGTTYTFLPPGPCVPGSLGGGTTQGPAGTVCSGVSFTLTVTGASFGTGLTYVWESSPDNSTWSPAAGTNNTATYTGTISTNTYFRRKITCSGTDAYSTSLLVTITIGSIPFSETFATYATTFPPTCWTRNNAAFVTGQAPSGYGIGLGSAKFDFYNAAAGTQLDLVSLQFTPVTSNYFLVFDHAYATFSGEVDQLVILYSTNGGTSYSTLITYDGGTSGPLNTAGGVLPPFTPVASQWATKVIALPAGTNRLLFRGISQFGNNLFVDNIIVTSCVPPSGLTATGLTPTTATLNWTASTSNPSGGYEWEVRTSGAPGSGATGLITSGTTAAGVTSANVAGLTPNTTYSLYVRASCGGPDFSIWAAGTFLTPCSAIAVPFVETFATYATTFPPTCWTRNDITFVTGQAPSAFGNGSGSAKFDFYNAASGTQLDLVSPIFTPPAATNYVMFDHAYATFSGEVDQLEILYSTDGGISYTSLITYDGGFSGPLNTAGGVLPSFTPIASQWANKVVALPAGTNRLLFRGTSQFGNNLYLDNITVGSCLPPSGLGLTVLAPTSTTLSWSASATNPSNGYQWEVRTSGAPGSGATGLATSGTTAAGVTSANVTGLTPFTTYTYYVRSDCGGSDFSLWAGYTFTTPCDPITIPFTENFSTYATTFPPVCWIRNDATYITGQAPSAYGVGLGSAKFDFYNASAGTQLDLISPLFAATPAGYGLVFDHAYATFAGEVDSLRIMYSTNGGATYSYLISYAGGGGGPLNTAGSVLPAFTPTAGQWANKAILLPTGTNRILFKGISAFGNNLFLDNIAVVSCLPPTGVNALAVLPTTVRVSFTSPGTSFIVEYGPAGFTPGAGNTAGPGGTVVFTASSPVTIAGLTPGTTYDFYVRNICTPGVDYSINVKATATTLCPATTVPYIQNFETSIPLTGFPTCTSMEDVNGNSGPTPNGGGGRWITNSVAQTYVSPNKSLWYIYDLGNAARGGDDWFYLQGLNLTGGTAYRVKCYYKGSDAPTWIEKFEIKYGTSAYSAAMTNLLYSNPGTNTNAASPFDSVIADFTPATTGVYYIGFHNISDPDQAFLFIDDISVKVAPTVDVGITGITLPALTCPANGVFIQATIKNYNTTALDFSLHPVNVTATITGAGTGTLTALLNTGTLAAGASMNLYLSPAFNFSSGGLYTITTQTSTVVPGEDPETANDANTTLVNVNPNPPVPVITPSAPQICAGNTVKLNTQFTPSPPPVALPAFSSGTIAVAVPDASAAGATHTLTVSGVPVGATITAMSVTLNMTHTWVGDMIFNLKAPNGNILNLDKYIGGTDAAGFNFVNTVISSQTTPPLPALSAGTAPRTGTFKPDAINTPVVFTIQDPTGYVSNAAAFSDLYSVPNGAWTLAMADGVGGDVGTLTSWSINITYQILTPVVTWTPVTGLYTNAAATTAYTGGDADSVWAKPAATTTYTVRATTLAGCSSSATVTVTVNPLPVITIGSIPDTVCTSDPLIPLVATPIGGTWTGIGVSGSNFVPPATAVGTYTLTYSYTSVFGCTRTATKNISVKDCPERIILLTDNAIILYPNPNTGLFNIRINSVLYNNLGMKVYTNNGVLVRTQQFGGLAWGRVVPIDLTNLPGGVYMVKFYYEGGVRSAEKTFKVVIGND